MDEYAGQQYVGIDLHRRRSATVRMTPEGKRLAAAVRIDNSPFEFAAQVASWGESPDGWVSADRLGDQPASLVVPQGLDVGATSPVRRPVMSDRRDGAERAGERVAGRGRHPDLQVDAGPES